LKSLQAGGKMISNIINKIINLLKSNKKKAVMLPELLMWILAICAIIVIAYMLYKYYPKLTENALSFQSQAQIE